MRKTLLVGMGVGFLVICTPIANAQAFIICETPRNAAMQIHGVETCRLPNGTTVKTTWVNGKRHGDQTWTCSNGKSITVRWQNDDPSSHYGQNPC